jgi:uncharacterized protein (TIGR00255 family)
MRSMTGYGRGQWQSESCRITVEIRAVNHRFTDVKIRGAGVAMEEAIAGKLRQHIERGAITATVRVEQPAGAAPVLDVLAARRAHAALSALAQELGTAAPTLELVLAQPGVTQRPADVADAGDEQAVAVAARAADLALEALGEMREREGAALHAELAQRTATLGRLAAELERLAVAVPDELRARLTSRLRQALVEAGGEVDAGRLAQEIALLVDRSDITEELVRLRSHLAQLSQLLGSAGAVGRRLDFVLQEVGRELNTLGSKSPSGEIVHRVVAAKVELEKLREQAQNVE